MLIFVRKGPRVDNGSYMKVLDNLQRIIAEVFVWENITRKVKATGVPIWHQESNDRWDRGVGIKEMQVVILINNYQGWPKSLDEMGKEVLKAINDLLPTEADIHGQVQIFLAESYLGEF
jgi:hypothetical protein